MRALGQAALRGQGQARAVVQAWPGRLPAGRSEAAPEGVSALGVEGDELAQWEG